jgi:hypothetical protein
LAEAENESNALRVPADSVDYTLTIHHNVISGQFEIAGWRQNMLVTIGMLEYALSMVKRERMKLEIQAEMASRPLVVPPHMRM